MEQDMNFLKVAVAVMTLSFGLGLVAESADAARLGGGKSLGAQRSITQRQATPPQATQQAAPATPAAAQAAGGNRWLGPLAGLAAGLGLGWLFANGGLGGMGSILLMLGAAFIIFMVVRALMRPKMAAGTGMGPRPLQYAGLGNETVAAPPPSQLTGSDAAWGKPQAPAVQPVIPAGFDVAGFLKQAKLNFIRLQEANDRGDLETLRDVTTDELFEKLATDIRERAGTQLTDVVTLDATLLEVVTEGNSHWASVRFSGQIRESAGAAVVPFSEVWHLSKPLQGEAGWMVAGIEQIS
jgi:predicted lipid-binding transport protein (Tim44 family)